MSVRDVAVGAQEVCEHRETLQSCATCSQLACPATAPVARVSYHGMGTTVAATVARTGPRQEMDRDEVAVLVHWSLTTAVKVAASVVFAASVAFEAFSVAYLAAYAAAILSVAEEFDTQFASGRCASPRAPPRFH